MVVVGRRGMAIERNVKHGKGVTSAFTIIQR